MPWDRTQSTNPKYRSKQHRLTRERLIKELRRAGHAQCAQPICIMPTRTITPGMPVHLGHDDTGTTYIGLVHAQCNITDGARRARAKQNPAPRRSRDW